MIINSTLGFSDHFSIQYQEHHPNILINANVASQNGMSQLCQPFQHILTGLAAGNSIIGPGSVLGGKIPKQYITNPVIIPMKKFMNHKCALHVHYGLNSILHMSVMMMCSSIKKIEIDSFFTVFAKHIFRKNSIITMIMLHLYSSLPPFPILKLLFAYDSFTCSNINLFLRPNNTSSFIIKYGVYIKAAIGSFPTKTTR